jgi:hypothetical protein
MLLSHEEGDGLPVSVRQIWFDLRSKPSFKTDAKMWMCGTEEFWERSLADLIAELWSLCDKPTLDGYQVEAVFQKDKVETTVLDKLDPSQASAVTDTDLAMCPIPARCRQFSRGT